MTRYCRHKKFQDPTLVPLADMLSNLVGILLFILIFTVLTTGGVVVPKRLPMEHKTDAKRLDFVCINNHLLHLDTDKLIKQFVEPLGKLQSYNQVKAWVKKFNTRQIEDEYFIVKGEGEAHFLDLGFQKQAEVDLSLQFTPREGKGDTITDMKHLNSFFLKTLAVHDSKSHFVYFLVHQDCLDIFTLARTLAIERNFETGWHPFSDDSILISLTNSTSGIMPAPL